VWSRYAGSCAGPTGIQLQYDTSSGDEESGPSATSRPCTTLHAINGAIAAAAPAASDTPRDAAQRERGETGRDEYQSS